MNASQWLTIIANISLITAIASAIAILFDIFIRGYRQKMPVMEWVWCITALYFSIFGLWAYWSIGRSHSNKVQKRSGNNHQRPYWQQVFVGTTHCGGGCTLGDIIAEWGVFFTGFTLYGSSLLTEYIFDFRRCIVAG